LEFPNWKIVRNLGFRWRRSEIRRKVLIEEDDILEQGWHV
jgi:hypothetical protein